MKEWGTSGNSSRSMSGGFMGGGDNASDLGSFHPLKHQPGQSAGADTTISQRHGLASSAFEGDYYDPDNPEEEEYKTDVEILEVIVRKHGKILLWETLERLKEFQNYAMKVNSMDRKLTKQASKQKSKEFKQFDDLNEFDEFDELDEIDELDEFSSVGGGAISGFPSAQKNKKYTKK
tara:strand:- start:2344 stop:2874 length:531 start_codon:yes stop_codon:yes gene_type:complete